MWSNSDRVLRVDDHDCPKHSNNDHTHVLDDRNQALPIPETRATPLGNLRTWVMAPYPYLVQVGGNGFANANVTASLDAVGIYWGSPLTVEAPSDDVEVLPILRSSELSWTDDDTTQVAFVDYVVPEETEPRLLAAALSLFAGAGGWAR